MSAPADASGPPPPATRASNLILIGYRGCGKTSIGQLVARQLQRPFVDTDELIVAAAGKSIRDIFAQDGEGAFRALESRVLAQVCAGARQIISVGGGAVLAPENRAILKATGLCIWLTAPADELYRRSMADPRSAQTRPALTAHAGLAEVRHLLGQRAPLYAAVADHVLDTAGRSVGQSAADLLALLARVGAVPGSA